jgi:hypothetical protein
MNRLRRQSGKLRRLRLMAGVAGGNAAVVHRMDEGMRISAAYFHGGVSAGAAV